MAQHNEVRVVGYIKEEPKVIKLDDEENAIRVIFPIRTVHRDVAGYPGGKFADLMVMCDSNEKNLRLMSTLKKYDVVSIKGVINIAFAVKQSKCPECGTPNYKENTTITFIYPIFIERRDSYANVKDKEEQLYRQYEEISNEIKLLGTVSKDPELIMVHGNKEINDFRNRECCKFPLGIDRKFYIPSQSNLFSDYPWIYSYGQDAQVDFENVKKGMVCFLDGFLQAIPIEVEMECEECGANYTYNDASYSIVPYSMEYMPWSHVPDEEDEEEDEA